MHWNHRVVRHKNDMKEPWWSVEEYWYGIHEVFYDDEGIADSCTQDPIKILGETVESIQEDIKRIQRALKKPTLDYQYFLDRKDKCTCFQGCDCQNPPPDDWDGSEGIYHISNSCPIHNDNPNPDPKCPIYGSW